MGETVNLRQWKKRQVRREAEQTAAQNRAASGISKSAKQTQTAEAKKAAALLDGLRIQLRVEP